MAKGLFALYGGKGKVGNMVAYKNPNVNNADSTVVRAYTANVKNPKTRKQAEQRMRMLPAQNFYRAFRTLLDHSWQGVKYGGRSYAKFMKLALADKTLAIPYQEKGDSNFVPGPYPMSSGSLPQILVDQAVIGQFGIPVSLILAKSLAVSSSTLGAISESLLALNEQLQVGDYLTFIQVKKIEGTFVPSFFRLKLDPMSTALLSTTPLQINVEGDEDTGVLSYRFGVDEPCGGCIIHSREPEQGSTTWLRSNASMVLAADAITDYRTAEAEAKAIESYQSRAGETNSHWYLNGGTE